MTDTLLNDTPAELPEAPTQASELTPRQTWLEGLPEAYKNDKVFANFNGVEDVYKAYSNAARMVGMDKAQVLRLPSELQDENPEAWNEVYDKIGRPKDVDGYELNQFGFEGNDADTVKAFAQKMHAKGATKAQVAEALTTYKGILTQAQEQYAEQQETKLAEQHAQIKAQFGEAYDHKIGQIKNLLNTKYPELNEVAKANPAMFEHPAVFKVLADLSEAMSEDKGIQGGATSSNAPMTPTEAKMELGKYQFGGEYWNIISNKNHPQHDAIMAKRGAAYQYAFPEGK